MGSVQGDFTALLVHRITACRFRTWLSCRDWSFYFNLLFFSFCRNLCDAGYYGLEGQTNKLCSGKCFAGFYCPPGSDSPTKNACGGANLYCPPGSSAPIVVPTGAYSLGSDDETIRPTYAMCEPGNYCINGVKYPCPEGAYGETSGLQSADCSGSCAEG